MIRSMTGFGEAAVERDSHAYHVEIRSVNNRYLKTAVRLPDELGFMETELEALVRTRLTRGSVTIRVYQRDLSAGAAQQINLAAIQLYCEQLQSVLASTPNVVLDLATLAQLPGVCQPQELTEQQREEGWQTVETLTHEALDRLITMRRTEGEALKTELESHCRDIREHLEVIRRRAPLVVNEYRNRLTARVEELIAGSGVKLAENDLLREVAVYAERSDIAEEIARLSSHLVQFANCLTTPEPAGRKLEFIAQEMLREANTIGSKASDPEIATHIIDIKGAIDRVKEQVQNVE